MVLYYFGYLLVGKLLIWTIQIFPPVHWFIGKQKGLFREYLEKLFECDFCLGTWVYFFLALIAEENILPLDYSIVSVFLTGLISAFVMHLITIGWNDKFRVMEIK